jgi:hypothetical protein
MFLFARTFSFVVLVAVVGPLGLVGCGGAPQPVPSEPQPPEAAPESAVSEPTADCSDGTCFQCGAGLCPSGFYCDEGARGGAACSWLPGCAGCACLRDKLSPQCPCEERSGNAFVRCQP